MHREGEENEEGKAGNQSVLESDQGLLQFFWGLASPPGADQKDSDADDGNSDEENDSVNKKEGYDDDKEGVISHD